MHWPQAVTENLPNTKHGSASTHSCCLALWGLCKASSQDQPDTNDRWAFTSQMLACPPMKQEEVACQANMQLLVSIPWVHGNGAYLLLMLHFLIMQVCLQSPHG